MFSELRTTLIFSELGLMRIEIASIDVTMSQMLRSVTSVESISNIVDVKMTFHIKNTSYKRPK